LHIGLGQRADAGDDGDTSIRMRHRCFDDTLALSGIQIGVGSGAAQYTDTIDAGLKQRFKNGSECVGINPTGVIERCDGERDETLEEACSVTGSLLIWRIRASGSVHVLIHANAQSG
jgi:hypothetical protein